MENAPRYCSITNEPMWEGWYFEGIGFFYAKYEKDALRICQEHDYATLDSRTNETTSPSGYPMTTLSEIS
jgi:hypothetical protein